MRKVGSLSLSELIRSRQFNGDTTEGTFLSLTTRSIYKTCEPRKTKISFVAYKNDILLFQFAVTEDHSLVLKNPSDLLSGEYELMADNGIGKPTVARTVVTVYPIFPMITLSVEKSIFKPGTEAKISCKVKGRKKVK